MGDKPNINVGGLEFGWDLEKGRFTFEEQDSVLFWITSAMKHFFDTIEEISGEESSNLVFETTGFRQGLVVGEYFQNIKNVSFAQVTDIITNTYASAGWGRASVHNLDLEKKILTVHLKDSWEHKINVSQGKKKGGNFLPAHYAGIFTGLLGANIWYKVIHYQIEGHECSVIEYAPSTTTVSNNIHQLARKKESEQISRLEALVEEKTRELKEQVKQLSSPLIPVLEGIAVVPLIGSYDEERSEELLSKTLHNLPSHKANYLILDLTGVDYDISHYTANLIEKIGSAASLIGTKTILVGITAELGIIFSRSGICLSNFECFQTLEHGIHYALTQNGRKLI